MSLSSRIEFVYMHAIVVTVGTCCADSLPGFRRLRGARCHCRLVSNLFTCMPLLSPWALVAQTRFLVFVVFVEPDVIVVSYRICLHACHCCHRGHLLRRLASWFSSSSWSPMSLSSRIEFVYMHAIVVTV